MAFLFTLCIGTAIAASVARDTEPCAVIAQGISSQNTGPYKVQSDLALQCLRSVPLDRKNDIEAVKAFRLLTTFESDQAHLQQSLPG